MHRRKRLAEMHAIARTKAKRSQEYMALEMGVSKRTVQNWEKGSSSPTFIQSIEWFRILETNPFPYFFKILNPEVSTDLKYKSDDDINKAFSKLNDTLSPASKRAILYVFTGNHGSSPTAVLELAMAYLHLPLKIRSSHTSTVIHDYVTEVATNGIRDNESLPNMEVLQNAYKQANESVLRNLEQYNVFS